jgi:signal transduction histidine kinase
MRRPPCGADPTHLEQVLWNLLLNAAEAMGGSGTIRVTLRSDGGRLRVAIEDSGVGIAEEVLARLFRPFVTTKLHGTGLGLPLCRKLVEAHGGTIAITSERGRGTTVQLDLPL